VKSGRRKRKTRQKARKFIVVMACRLRDMKELGRVIFPLTNGPVVAHPGSPSDRRRD